MQDAAARGWAKQLVTYKDESWMTHLLPPLATATGRTGLPPGHSQPAWLDGSRDADSSSSATRDDITFWVYIQLKPNTVL
jgi:hypothetical protein